MKYANILVLALAITLLVAPGAEAANFNAIPAAGTFSAGSQFTVNVRIDTAGETINAAQGTLLFNASLMQVKSISKEGSVFNFWLQEPEFSNTAGAIKFIGGTINGVSGSSLQVIKIVFTAKDAGAGGLSFSDAAITAADSTGSNILVATNGATYTLTAAGRPVAPVGTPVPVTRTPVTATALPDAAVLSVPLYPDPESWYSAIAPFAVSWQLPPDVSGISTAVNSDPRFEPAAKSEGLFESKTFPAVSADGIYFAHVRFQNSKGWGPTQHYRIAVDSQPPVPFKIDMKSGLAGDNPTPILSYPTTDALSGISHYEIIVNTEPPIIASDSTTTLTPKPPGEYAIRVRAVDLAGNSIEDKVNVEVLPIDSPVINSINRRVQIGTDEILFMRGSAIPDSVVVVTLTDSAHRLVLQDESRANAQGVWEYRLLKEVRIGDYYVSVTTRDSRGALSLPTSPLSISFVEHPIITMFGWDITLRILIMMLVALMVVAAAILWVRRMRRMARSQREAVIISRDVRNALDSVKKDLDEITQVGKKKVSAATRDMKVDATSKKIKDSLDKMDKYLGEDLEKLG